MFSLSPKHKCLCLPLAITKTTLAVILSFYSNDFKFIVKGCDLESLVSSLPIHLATSSPTLSTLFPHSFFYYLANGFDYLTDVVACHANLQPALSTSTTPCRFLASWQTEGATYLKLSGTAS